MDILHATDFHNRVNTGITVAVNELSSSTLTEVLPNGSVSLLSMGETDVAVHEGVHHFSVAANKGVGKIWRFASHYAKQCAQIIRKKQISLVHIHGAWMYPQFAAVRAASHQGIPIVLTNHGCVPWALRQPDQLGALKKRVYMALMKNKLFQRVTIQHAITQEDRDALHAMFPGTRIEVIPNFIDLSRLDGLLRPPNGRNGVPYLLFVGRLHPTKGVDLLVEAFGRAEIPRDWRLIIVGPEVDRTHAMNLRRMIAASPRSSRIELRGPIWDPAEKYALMRDAWVTVVPSHIEVVAFVNLESSACSTPTITTRHTGLFDWTEGGGLLIEDAVEPLSAALSECSQWSDRERRQRGDASRRLVERNYSSVAVMPRWMELYRSLT